MEGIGSKTGIEIELFDKKLKGDGIRERYLNKQKAYNEAIRQKNKFVMKKNMLIKKNAEINSGQYQGT